MSKLSPEEIRILEMVCQGLTCIEIAKETRMARQSVDNAKSRILFKLNAKKMPQAIYKAFQAGILKIKGNQ